MSFHRPFITLFLGLLLTTRGGVLSWVSAAEQSQLWQQPRELMPTVTPGEQPGADSQPFHVLSDYQVERLFVVPREQLGSWVALTSDPEGRLYASDQGGQGLARISPAAHDGSTETMVEKVPAAISGAQGLLWAFDALYAVCNGGGFNGLFRLTDTNGDDHLDYVEKLHDIPGGGEHGAHNILLSPDGSKLFIICGNHTPLPFAAKNVTQPQTMAGIRPNQRRVTLAANGTSRLPANWDEDMLITRMWDGNGHATGRLAPGGYIVSTNPEGKQWELWSAGYRNPYDFGFNADGELFAYDADMEWDFGMPWYRPTRVNHVTSGSELGWRSGTAKWPAAYPDSLPAAVDIGPGSPVGASFGYGAKVPGKYQKAFYICDWTFGTMYAIHLTPNGSTYTAEKEEFVSRNALPLTDMTIGKDGAIYFAVGGRGGQSELYRVSYTGPESIDPIDAHDAQGSAERSLRRKLEAFHAAQTDPTAAIALALEHLGHEDRFIRYAARIALEHQPVSQWQSQALAQTPPPAIVTAAIAVARQAEPTAQAEVLAALDRIDPTGLDAADKLDLIRAYELTLIRLGEPTDAVKASLAAKFAPLFPAGEFELDRALANLLVAVRAPGIVSTLVGLLATTNEASGETNLAPNEDDLARLAARNTNYGRAVTGLLKKRTDMLQIHYAYVLRTVNEKNLWSIDDRKGYFAWLDRARTWTGGNSYRKFLQNIETESLAGLSDNEKLALETLGVRKPYVPPPLPKPEGPGQKWTVESVLAVANNGLNKGSRNFEHGKRTFAAARCIVCHRYSGDGGATGPDLTQAAGRFKLKDLVEAIVEPSKAVSDQYQAHVIQTTRGKVHTGRIISENEIELTVVTDPEDASKFVLIKRDDIDEMFAANQSLMPAGLLDQLNEQEVLDLLAYTLSRGNRRDDRFKRKR